MHTARNLILAAAATAGLVALSIPATASAGCNNRRADGTIIGAVVGGGIGSSIARGSSRGAGTVAGALLGGAIGNSVAGSDCYYGDRYNSGYAYYGNDYYDPYYGGPSVYVAPGAYGYHYYTPGYRYYGHRYYRPYWHRRW